jgi:hypothetical protein
MFLSPAKKIMGGKMDFSIYWLIIYAWRNRLIDREKFKSLWTIVQALGDERKQIGKNAGLAV